MKITIKKEGRHTTIVTAEGLPDEMFGHLRGYECRIARSGMEGFIRIDDGYYYSHKTSTKSKLRFDIESTEYTQREVKTKMIAMFKALAKEIREGQPS